MQQKQYRMWYIHINSGDEFFIDVDTNDDILPALKRKPQYVAEPDNWECFDCETIKENYHETFTAFLYEEDGFVTADLSTYDDANEAIQFAQCHNWDEVVNDYTGEIIWRK